MKALTYEQKARNSCLTFTDLLPKTTLGKDVPRYNWILWIICAQCYLKATDIFNSLWFTGPYVLLTCLLFIGRPLDRISHKIVSVCLSVVCCL